MLWAFKEIAVTVSNWTHTLFQLQLSKKCQVILPPHLLLEFFFFFCCFLHSSSLSVRAYAQSLHPLLQPWSRDKTGQHLLSRAGPFFFWQLGSLPASFADLKMKSTERGLEGDDIAASPPSWQSWSFNAASLLQQCQSSLPPPDYRWLLPSSNCVYWASVHHNILVQVILEVMTMDSLDNTFLSCAFDALWWK